MIQHTPLAMAYAEPLLELASEQNQAEAIGAELIALKQVLEQNPSFVQFLADPAIGHDQRWSVLQRTLAGQVSPLLHNFLGVMNEKGRLGSLGAVIDAYGELLFRKQGKVNVDVTVARPLDDAGLEQVRSSVSSALKKDAIIHQHVDESLIGGLTLRIEDRLIDASVKYQLKAMKEQLLAARPGR